MKTHKTLLLGSAAALVVVSGAMAADLPVKAAAAQYMKVCDLYGNGFFWIPGSDTCVKIGGYIAPKWYYNTTSSGHPLAVSNTQGAGDRTVSPYNTRARANVQIDTRTQTQYGTLRTLTSIHYQNQGQSETFNTARAYIQWAGFTFGRISSYAEVGKISGGWSDLTFVTGRYNPNGINQIAYSHDLGNGFVLTLGADERSTKPLTNLSSPTALTVAGASEDSHAGEKWPDVHVDLRQSGDFGYWQISGMVHDLAASYYGNCTQPGTTQCGHPRDTVGFNVNFGTELRLPQFGPRDRALFTINYGQGLGPWNSGGNITTPGLFGSGNNVAIGFANEAYFVDGSSIHRVTGWSIEAAYEHGWSAILQTNVLFGIAQYLHDATTKNWFLDAVCNGGGGTGATKQINISANRNANSCNPDFTVWQVGSRTRWRPVPGLDLSATAAFTQVVSGFEGAATVTRLLGARPSGAYTFGNQGIFSVGTQVARQFNVGGAIE